MEGAVNVDPEIVALFEAWSREVEGLDAREVGA